MNSLQQSMIGGAHLTEAKQKSKVPARLDFLQSATGLFLALFMWGHMFFVSSILISKDFMWTISKMFEGYFFFDKAYPILVSGLGVFIFIVFITHAGIAMRKFPINYRQYKIYREHMAMMKHQDTNLWFYQIFTGFAMFFLGSIHLYIIITSADAIGPYASADRVVIDWMWPLYILLLISVEFHASIGLYRLAVKWGWFEGEDAKKSRKRLKMYKHAITVFFLTLGFLSLIAYIKIGLEQKANNNVGNRYTPSYIQEGAH